MSKQQPAPSDDAALIRLMCDAYCRGSGEGGGRQRYATAMERVLRAIEAAGYDIVPPKPFNDWARIG